MIWRPHTFGPTGLPITPQAPAALRVEGGEATVEQRNMAQAVFVQFCATSRLALGANPTQAGQLPDGSRYRITTVGPQTVMQLWPVAADDDDRRSGVVIALSDLAGDVIAEHHTNGVPTRYLLTPRVSKGTRIPTGRWTVRKLRTPYDGGKAVHASSNGRAYFTGIEGRGELLYPFNNGLYGSVNEYAYNVEDRDNLNMYRGGNKVCVSDDEDSPIPFILEWENSARYAAQLVTRVEAGVTSVDLLVGPFATSPDSPVGPVVSTVTFPSGTSIQRFKISVSKDGRRARTTSSNGSVTCQLTFHITPTTLAVESTGCIPVSTRTVWDFESPTTSPVNNHNFVDTDGIVKGIPGETGTGVYTQQGSPSHVFAFGPRGQEFEAITSGLKTYQTSRNRTTSSGGIQTGDYYLKLIQTASNTELDDFVGEGAVGTVVTEESDEYVFNTTAGQYSGGGWRIDRGFDGNLASIYYNRFLQFAIYMDVVPETGFQSWVYTNEGGSVRQPTGSSTTPSSRTLLVRHRNNTLLERVLGSTESGAFIAYSASDPMTGALVVNLIQVTPNLEGARTRLKSWIFLVDDTGVKALDTLMPGLPPDTCAITNKLLYSL